jgi:hypothetical protein
MVPLFFFPAELLFVVAGPEETKNPAGANILRLIRIRLATASLKKSHLLVKRKMSGAA